MTIGVSACLLGEAVRYDGASKPNAAVRRLAARVAAVPVCPEVAGGLPVPRVPSERQADGRVLTQEGRDVTDAYGRGAAEALRALRAEGVTLAVLKARSPSCGSGRVYDGSFTGQLVAGDGVAAERLKGEGICVVPEDVVAACEPSLAHPVAIILGQGLAQLVDAVRPVRRISYREIVGYPSDATVAAAGHEHEAIVGTLEGVPVVLYPGRVHLYQGYSAAQVTAIVRHAHKIGCRDLFITGSSGAIVGQSQRGLGLITDHLNLTGTNPLVDPQVSAGVPNKFVSMAAEAYSPYLREICSTVAAEQGVELGCGVYAGVVGPSYETQAEVRALGLLGASYVGFSCVLETIMARALGMNVLGLTLAINYAGQTRAEGEEERAFAAAQSAAQEKLLRGVLRVLGTADESAE